MARINKNLVSAIILVVGIFGALVAGLAIGLFFTETDDFTEPQRLYITGVAKGAAYRQTQMEIERQPNPTVDEHNILRNPHQRCIREYYPSKPIELAGCLDATKPDIQAWHMP